MLIRTAMLIAILTSALIACSDSSSNRPAANNRLAEVTDFEAYVWNEVPAGRRWEARAGLQALELDGKFFVFGGRTPRPPSMPNPIPGDSDIYNDVWVSEDQGESWEKILESGGDHWLPRAYFKAVVKDDYLYVIGGQDYELLELPFCAGQPPEICPPFVSNSSFFNDVWRSGDGINWEQMTETAGWEGRAGLSVAVLNDEIYVLGGSKNDDVVFTGGPPLRIYFNDVWKSSDGAVWELVTDSAPWEARAGGVLVTRGDYLYLLGGENGFLCDPLPDCEQPYFNDVWRSIDGANWELLTESAGWSSRPGHQCGVIQDDFVCFGGYGYPENPVDVWVSSDAVDWTMLSGAPWNATLSEQIKYDFDIVVTDAYGLDPAPAIFTFGGDRETFDFDDPENYLRIDDDIWKFSLPE